MNYGRRFRDRAYNMADGLVMFASLGFTNISRIAFRVRYLIACFQHARRPRNFVVPGTYISRRGETVHVDHNLDGWLDKLPFVVTIARNAGSGPHYTVDQDGLVWPHTPWRKSDDLLPHF
jgi:hypothetical protein